jgi:PilZ domain-containing protein
MTLTHKKNYDGQLVPLGRDRRLMPRYPFTASAEALDPQSRARMTARTSDLSRGGCYVDTFCPFPKNSNVKLRLECNKEFLVAQAKVVYSKIGMGMGLCFTPLEQPHKRVLDKWIGELSGTAPLTFDDTHFDPHVDAHVEAHVDVSPSQGSLGETQIGGTKSSATNVGNGGEVATGMHAAELVQTREGKRHARHTESNAEAAAPANNDAGFVLGELIIALMRRGALSSSEGNALLCKLVSPGTRP